MATGSSVITRLVPWLKAVARADMSDLREVLSSRVARDLAWFGPHPLNAITGLDDVIGRFWRPLKNAFPDLERHDSIAIEGDFETGHWVATAGYLVGTFARDWIGFPATEQATFLRYGEFLRLEGETVVEIRIIIDLIDLMRQSGCNPLPPAAGVEIVVPGPFAGDGLVLTPPDPAETAASLALVEDMIFGGLRNFDGKNLASMGMERFWSHNMMWYGPGGIGTTRGIEGFQTYHQAPFLRAFPDRVGGNHRARIASGLFVASTGWPSVEATHADTYLGKPGTGQKIGMRVMDFWRRDGDLLGENWVLIDIPHLLFQSGYDLVADAREGVTSPVL